MQASMWNTIVNFFDTWGKNPLVDVIAGSLVTLILVFLRQIGNAIVYLIKWSWMAMRKQGKDFSFEKAYLNWLINRYRFLGLIPASTVTTRWGEERRIVDLEKVYVTLSISSRHEDQNLVKDAENISSWHKRFWLYPLLERYLWPYISLFFMLFLIISLIFILLSILSIISPYILTSTSFYISVLALFWIVLGALLLYLYLSKSIFLRKESMYQPQDLSSIIDKHRQLIIQGDPGSGKTTLLRYLAVTCARTLRNDKRQGDQQKLVKRRLNWDICPFPILVTLRRHSNVIDWGEEKDLIYAIVDEMSPELKKRCPEGFFERQIHKGNCLILLDAFDELNSFDARMEMARRMSGFLSIYQHQNNRMVVTTRLVGYEGQLDQYNFQLRTVQKLEPGEVRALIKQRYRAIALSETAGWQSHDAVPIIQAMQEKSERLISKVENVPRLAQLAMNPLLLSLIVLIHYVKVELPEQRDLLYRDCVEILTEQWQRSKRKEIGQQDVPDDLTLSQKLVLLQAIALTMQQKRKDVDRRTLLSQKQVQEIIARKLPDVLGSQLPTDEAARSEICDHKAGIWIKGIQLESGILVEQGLDEDGNPLVCFSHLTFQEYLAAIAINENQRHQALLKKSLLQPAWREVVLLYAALARDATSLIKQLIDIPHQPEGVLLAGACLAERVKYVKIDIQQLTLQKLKESFKQTDEQIIENAGKVLAAIGGNDVTTFMREQVQNFSSLEGRLVAIRALGQTKAGSPQIEMVQEDLVRLVEVLNDVDVMVAAREALAQVGDPRFTSKEPRMVLIPPQTYPMIFSPRTWKELRTSFLWQNSNWLMRVLQIRDLLDFWPYTKIPRLRKQIPYERSFEIGKYLITNIEYARFVEATGHRFPNHWIEGIFPTEKATHPVVGVTLEDAHAYCKWLSVETGKQYRLPTEWEWEWAATGQRGGLYSWDGIFDRNKCNTKEAGIEETTPVGSYLIGESEFGVNDAIGNVWEITRGCYNFFFIVLKLLCFTIYFSFDVFSLLSLISDYKSLTLSTILLLILMTLSTTFYCIYMTVDSIKSIFGFSLRGGAFNSPEYLAHCSYREHRRALLMSKYVGFRCLREL